MSKSLFRVFSLLLMLWHVDVWADGAEISDYMKCASELGVVSTPEGASPMKSDDPMTLIAESRYGRKGVYLFYRKMAYFFPSECSDKNSRSNPPQTLTDSQGEFVVTQKECSFRGDLEGGRSVYFRAVMESRRGKESIAAVILEGDKPKEAVQRYFTPETGGEALDGAARAVISKALTGKLSADVERFDLSRKVGKPDWTPERFLSRIKNCVIRDDETLSALARSNIKRIESEKRGVLGSIPFFGGSAGSTE